MTTLPNHAPDARRAEYDRVLIESAELQGRIIALEIEFRSLDQTLQVFECYYLGRVQHKHALLDALKVETLEVWLAHLRATSPDDASHHEPLLEEARARARESTETIPPDPPKRFKRHEPSDDATKLYREIARRVHPDLACDQVQANLRHSFMCALNAAYRDGDLGSMQSVLDTWEDAAVAPLENLDEAIARINRQIARARGRVQELRSNLEVLRRGEVHEIYQRACKAESQGRDLVLEIVEDLDRQIEEARVDLARLRQEVAA